MEDVQFKNTIASADRSSFDIPAAKPVNYMA